MIQSHDHLQPVETSSSQAQNNAPKSSASALFGTSANDEASEGPGLMSDYFGMGPGRHDETTELLSGSATDAPPSDAPISGVHVPSDVQRQLQS